MLRKSAKFAVLAYSVTSFTAEYTHQGSRRNFIPENPKPELAKELSIPTFLFCSTDAEVPPENCVAFSLALRNANVPGELHIFENAPHGVGLDLGDPYVGEWSGLLPHWFRERKLLPGSSQQAVRAGHDPQLEKAVEVVMELLKKNPPPLPPQHPPYPNYQKSGTH
jgi:hypothetical protein